MVYSQLRGVEDKKKAGITETIDTFVQNFQLGVRPGFFHRVIGSTFKQHPLYFESKGLFSFIPNTQVVSSFLETWFLKDCGTEHKMLAA